MEASSLFTAAVLRRTDELRDICRAERYIGGDPFIPASVALLLLSGGELEPRSYKVLSHEETVAAHAALKTSRHWVAHGMLEHRPELERKVLEHPAARKKIDSGPLGRMPGPARAVRLLSKLLLDPHEAAALERRGYFAFDDGTHRAALVIDYAWRQATGFKTWLTEKPKNTRVASAAFARRLFRERANSDRVRLTEARLTQAWYFPDERRTERDRRLYTVLAARDDDEALRITAVTGLADLGIRAGRPDVIEASLEHLEAWLPTKRLADPGLRVLKAWSLLHGDRANDARDLTLMAARSRSPAARASAIPLLRLLGEEKKATVLMRSISRN
jgi:hypothetical protein